MSLPAESPSPTLLTPTPAPQPPLPTSQAPPKTRFLDGLRGLAALYVVLHHASYLLIEGPTLQKNSGGLTHLPANPLQKILFHSLSLFDHGQSAVIFFFVLSGFVIHLRYAKQLKAASAPTAPGLAAPRANARFGWPTFLFRRARRLYPPLLAALLLTTLFDSLGSRHFPPIYSHTTPYYMINLVVTYSTGPLVLLGNLAFLMTCQFPHFQTFVPYWGTDGPLWSLFYEWWFYMLYPLFWSLSKRSILLATTALLSLFALTFLPQIWPLDGLRTILASMPAWWFGALLADVYAQRIPLRFSTLAFLIFIPLLLILPLLFIHHPALEIQRLLLGLFFSGLIAACFHLEQRGLRLRLLERLKPLGDMSYTLYLIHFPLMVLLSGYLMSQSPTHHLPPNPAWFFLGITLSLALAWPLHLLVEKPFTASSKLRPTNAK